MITGINESKTLTMHISSKCKYKLDSRNCSLQKWWGNDKCRCECKKCHVCEKDYVWNPATCNCEDGKYLASTTEDSMLICDEIIKSYEEETILITKATYKTENFYILLSFLLITIVLLIAVSIYCYLIKYRAKQKNVLPFHFKDSELNEIIH